VTLRNDCDTAGAYRGARAPRSHEHAAAVSVRAMLRTSALIVTLAALGSCGGTKTPPPNPHACGDGKVQEHTLDPHEDGKTHTFVPCSGAGKHDYSGAVHVESTPQGIHVVIDATDDDFNHGAVGSPIKGRDAVIVYPQGPGSKAIEVPLKQTATGYHGEITIPYDDLDKLHDEGTKLKVTVFDHDDSHPADKHEELSVEVAVSTGKSCEKAREENSAIDMGKKGGPVKPDLSEEQLSGPVKSSAFFNHCNLKDAEKADICVAIKDGKPIGVSVSVSPKNKTTASCIDRATRKLKWPFHERLEVIHQKF